MKYLFVLLLPLLLLTTCANDDDDTISNCPALTIRTNNCVPLDQNFGEEAYADFLIGTWKLVRVYRGFGPPVGDACEQATPDRPFQITFSEDGMATRVEDGVTTELPYRVDVVPCAEFPCPLVIAYEGGDLGFAPTVSCDNGVVDDGVIGLADGGSRTFRRQ